MSENEGSIKRSIEETTDIDEHKKQKLNYEDTSTFVSKETGESVNTPVAITSTPTGVKARLTKNDLTSVGEEINKKMKQDNTVSADRSKAVTPLPEPEKSEEITSEQLLFALTSVPEDTPTTTNNNNNNNDDSNSKKLSTPIPPLTMPVETKPTTMSTSSLVSGLNIPPKLPTLSPPSKTNTNTSLSLPDISAALRRLSSASVIEHLSPRLPLERKGSLEPSEILGNALAAVAATPSVQATIGNLAANISTLLNSGLEETRRRRKSSIAANVLFSNMMVDLMTRPQQKPKLIIKNEKVWKMVEGIEEKSLGVYLYSPHLILPNFENGVNGLIEIRIPARYLTFDNVRVRKRALWGTDIYTDDSDIVAMVIHSGKYQPHWIEPDDGPFISAILGTKPHESVMHRHRYVIPDHDLKVTVKVLPTLQSYAGSIRHKLKSREWGKHDGMSLFINKVEKIKKGDAKLKGRSTLKSNIFAHESYRKLALGLNNNKKEKEKENAENTREITPNIQNGRVKKTSRVMRMFKIHSEMKNSK